MYKEIKIDQIQSNPNNPRTSFVGAKFEDLVRSIKEKGVLEPILVRPLDGKYEIVAGERRYRAALQLAGEYPQLLTIPSLIRQLTDDEAFEIMIIENLQREDLTPLEEAQSFEKYAQKHGKDGIQALGKRTGIQPAYIRRRIAVLQLPKKALEAWNKETLSFGHLEELIRLKATKDLKEVLDRLFRGYRGMTVKDLRDYINSRIPLLTKAKFDKTECSECMHNSDVQKKLWDIESLKKTHCLNPKCFTEKQVSFLTENWEETPWAKKFKTNGFAFDHDLQWEDWNILHSGPFKKCRECSRFRTIIKLDGTLDKGQACVKGKTCFESLSRSQQQKEARKEKKGEEHDLTPRKPWHGEHFREAFFKEQIPEQFKPYQQDDIKMLRMMPYAMIKMKWELCERFKETVDLVDEDYYMEEGRLFGAIAGLNSVQLLHIMKELSLHVILSNDVGAKGRWLAGKHIGIELAKEWAPTDEYYNLKTIKELLEYGDKIGIFLHKKAIKFLQEKLKRKKFSACKKTELVRVFKESGINLVGKVPDEILGEGDK